MKVVYYFGTQRAEKEKYVVRSIYGSDVQFIQQKPWSVISSFDQGDFLICNDVEDLADNSINDIDTVIKEYMNILRRGVDLIFDRSTQCNSLFIKTLITPEQDFETVLRKCILNYSNQKSISEKYAKKHVVTAASNGKRVGIKKGTKLTTKKSVEMKSKIKALSKDFNGKMHDEELMEHLGIARNSYYKYKKALREEIENGSIRPK